MHRVDDRGTQIALRRARRVRRGPLTLSCVADDSANPRISYAVGRRAGGAVERNRIRRRLRAVMHGLSPRLVGRAWLVGAGEEASDLRFHQLETHCRSAVEALSR